MGDPKKIRKTYQTPGHPWVAARIEEEKVLSRAYGTKNKKELYKMGSALKRFKDLAKKLSSRTDAQSQIEQEHLMNKLVALGLVQAGASLDDILSLSLNDLMNRRLQTVMVKRMLARTPNQARQLIIHGHVMIAKKIISAPSYLVKVAEESAITFRPNSPFNNESHPERFSEEELKAQRDRQAAKAAKKTEGEVEEVPPTFDESEIEDPEEMGAKKTEEKTVEEVKPELPSEEAKEEAPATEEKKAEGEE